MFKIRLIQFRLSAREVVLWRSGNLVHTAKFGVRAINVHGPRRSFAQSRLEEIDLIGPGKNITANNHVFDPPPSSSTAVFPLSVWMSAIVTNVLALTQSLAS